MQYIAIYARLCNRLYTLLHLSLPVAFASGIWRCCICFMLAFGAMLRNYYSQYQVFCDFWNRNLPDLKSFFIFIFCVQAWKHNCFQLLHYFYSCNRKRVGQTQSYVFIYYCNMSCVCCIEPLSLQDCFGKHTYSIVKGRPSSRNVCREVL